MRPAPSRKFAAIGLLIVPLFVGGFMLQDRSQRESVRLFSEVMQLVSGRFVDTVTQADLYEKAARGLLAELNDPYTELLSPKELEGFTQRTGGRYGGVGMQIEMQEVPGQGGRVTVARVFPHTPAEAAGIREGDRIIGVDTASTRGWKLDQVSGALLGTPGTRVRARFERPGVPEPIEVNFTRAIVKIPAVPYSITFDGIGYVPLQQFNEFATEELEAALRKFQREGARGVVLDLRGNPGGILEQSLSVSNLFLNNGSEIASVRGRGFPDETYAARGRAVAATIPMVVLTDGYSASASEIVAGALQDHDRALIIGTTTFGKGLVQTVFPLDGGYALKMTTAKWFTPSGRSIQKDRTTVDGVAMEYSPDSLETDSVKADRPEFQSKGGRTIFGGGAITPDIIVRPDTISSREQEFLRSIAPSNQQVYVTLSDYALQLKGSVQPNFTVTQEWRDEFYRRLQSAGVEVDRALYADASPTINRLLENRVARYAFGDSTAKRMSLEDDAQLRRALEVLGASRTQADLFARAGQQVRRDD
jgi:carboxyl-terminal processing protease